MGEAIMTSARGGIGGTGGKYKLQVRIFNSNGTFVVPGNVKNNTFKVMCYGGGGSSDGYCGGGGGYMNIMELNNLPTSVSIPITIGTGGFRNTINVDLKGNTGGTTTFGSYVSANGGTGGSWNSYGGGSGGSGGGGGAYSLGGGGYGSNGGIGYQFGGGGAAADGKSRDRSSYGQVSAILYSRDGGNGGEYGGGGGACVYADYVYNYYRNSNSNVTTIDNANIGIGGKYGGNGGTSMKSATKGINFSTDFLNIQDASLILLNNSMNGKAGAGDYKNNNIAGGGGGGGYGGKGGNGGNGYIKTSIYDGCEINVAGGGAGGGGGYGADGGNGTNGRNAVGGYDCCGGAGGGGGGYGGKGADANRSNQPTSGIGGGGGGYGPSNYGAGGGGTAINGLNGKSGICIIEYYELSIN